MNVELIVATYGTDWWRERGDTTYTAQLIAHEHVLHGRRVHIGRIPDVPEIGSAALAMARNTAAHDSDADWLCFLDADDALGPGYFEAMDRAAQAQRLDGSAPGMTLYVPAVEYVLEDGTLHSPARNLNDGRPFLEINHAVIGTLVPRQLFLDVGGFRDLPAYEDWDLWLRCERAGAVFIDVPDAVYVATVRPGSRNRQQAGILQGAYWSIRNGEERARGIR